MNPSELFRPGGAGVVAFYTLIGIALFVLQAIPFTGIFLMILGGPIWIGLLVHLLMAHLAVLAFVRKSQFGWLALPIAYYVVGFGIHLQSVRVANDIAQDIERENASQSMSVTQPFRYVAAGPDGLQLLELYRVASAYRGEDRQHEKQEYGLLYYAKDSECSLASKGYYYADRFNPWTFKPDLFYYVREPDKTKQCISSKSVYDIEANYAVKTSLDSSYDGQSLVRTHLIAWEAGDYRSDPSVKVRVGSISTLPPILTFLAGCGLDSGTPAWRCGASPIFGGEVFVGVKKRSDRGNPFIPTRDPETWEVTALARALGLTPRQPTD